MENLYVNWYRKRKISDPFMGEGDEEILEEREDLSMKGKNNLWKILIVAGVFCLIGYVSNFIYHTLEAGKIEKQIEDFCKKNNQGDNIKYPFELIEKRNCHEAQAFNPFYIPKLE